MDELRQTSVVTATSSIALADMVSFLGRLLSAVVLSPVPEMMLLV
jgi:hypothetical protein